MRFQTPNAKRPGVGSPVASSTLDGASSETQGSNLQLPPQLERRLIAIEDEIAAVKKCVLACRGERCPVTCWTTEVAS